MDSGVGSADADVAELDRAGHAPGPRQFQTQGGTGCCLATLTWPYLEARRAFPHQPHDGQSETASPSAGPKVPERRFRGAGIALAGACWGNSQRLLVTLWPIGPGCGGGCAEVVDRSLS